ncbi:MAG: biotin transporter BioY [Gemmatimonadota bacterium]
MTTMPSVAPATSKTAARLRRAAVATAGALLVAGAAQFALPLPGTPVPMTLQPLAVLLVGGLLGARLGFISLVIYIEMGVVGLPVFTPGGVPGMARFFGPTGGYLFMYPAAAWLVGRLAESGSLRAVVLGPLAGIALIHLGGAAQLLVLTGSAQSAIAMGLVPFVVGDLLKVAIAALVITRLLSTARALR